jgi:hypothetical protein
LRMFREPCVISNAVTRGLTPPVITRQTISNFLPSNYAIILPIVCGVRERRDIRLSSDPIYLPCSQQPEPLQSHLNPLHYISHDELQQRPIRGPFSSASGSLRMGGPHDLRTYGDGVYVKSERKGLPQPPNLNRLSHV